MAKTKIKDHTHKLKKHRFKSGNETFFCVDDCNYKVTPALALGKTTICWRCGESFNLNDYSLRLVKPHCEMCHKSKHAIKNEILPPLSKEVKEQLRNGSWDTGEVTLDYELAKSEIIARGEQVNESLSLSERLKKTTRIDHSKHEDESDEEL